VLQVDASGLVEANDRDAVRGFGERNLPSLYEQRWICDPLETRQTTQVRGRRAGKEGLHAPLADEWIETERGGIVTALLHLGTTSDDR
jgi:hypothetical protein